MGDRTSNQRNPTSEPLPPPVPILRKKGFRSTIYFIIASFIVIFVFQTGEQLFRTSTQNATLQIDSQDLSQDIARCMSQDAPGYLRLLGMKIDENGPAPAKKGKPSFRDRILATSIADALLDDCVSQAEYRAIEVFVSQKAQLKLSLNAAAELRDPIYEKTYRIALKRTQSHLPIHTEAIRKNFVREVEDYVPSYALFYDNISSSIDSENHAAIKNTSISIDLALFTFSDYIKNHAPVLEMEPSKEELKPLYNPKEHPQTYHLRATTSTSYEKGLDIISKNKEKDIFSPGSDEKGIVTEKIISHSDPDFKRLYENKVQINRLHPSPLQLGDGMWYVFKTTKIEPMAFDDVYDDEKKRKDLLLQERLTHPREADISAYKAYSESFIAELQKDARESSVILAAEKHNLSVYGRTLPFGLDPDAEIETGSGPVNISLSSTDQQEISYNLLSSPEFLMSAASSNGLAIETLVAPRSGKQESDSLPQNLFSFIVGNRDVTYDELNDEDMKTLEEDAQKMLEEGMRDRIRDAVITSIKNDNNYTRDIDLLRRSYGIDQSKLNDQIRTHMKTLLDSPNSIFDWRIFGFTMTDYTPDQRYENLRRLLSVSS